MPEAGTTSGGKHATPSRTASWDLLHLLDGVREVARLVDSVDITKVTQRPFDDARCRCPGFEMLPTARSICRRLDLPWSTVLELAALPPARRTVKLGRLHGEREPADLTSSFLTYALRLIATRLNKPILTPSEYDFERDALMAEDRCHWRHGGQLWLPTADQVRGFADSWNHALAHAGLAPGRSRGGKGATRGHAATVIEVLDRCYEHHGVVATYTQLLAFARANGVPMRNRPAGRPWSAFIEDWRAQRRERGLPAPQLPAPGSPAPDFNQDVGAALPGERKSRYAPSFDDAVAAVARYLQSLEARQRPSARRYDQWAARQEEGSVPWASEFRRHHGGWLNVLTAARAKVRAGAH